MEKREEVEDEWIPKTGLGEKVKDGEITDIGEILGKGKRPREVEIVDKLVPDLEDEILNVNLVQRMHRSGRRMSFRVTAVVGNRDGIIGMAHTSAGEVAPSIQKAIDNAKLNVIEIRRGCGSWECGCGRPHTVPLEVTGREGSVSVNLKPAPRGLGIAASEIPGKVLELAGIEDVWTKAKGQTRTTINFGLATFDALRRTTKVAMSESFAENVKTGKVGVKDE